ncbi:MAG: hypothetical protein JO246_12700 [Frankiaceae bacterium]|nr:hypothetical protein [Frankiaceae bacterium]MBV9870437.1 hypothetical protein [Frankiaceae bacterium]
MPTKGEIVAAVAKAVGEVFRAEHPRRERQRGGFVDGSALLGGKPAAPVVEEGWDAQGRGPGGRRRIMHDKASEVLRRRWQ